MTLLLTKLSKLCHCRRIDELSLSLTYVLYRQHVVRCVSFKKLDELRDAGK